MNIGKWAVCWAVLAVVAGGAWAQEAGDPDSSHGPWEQYGKHIQTRSVIGKLGPDLFGDEVNLYNGGLSFSITDISVPGNSSLPVELKRTFTVSDKPGNYVHDLPMADWDLDLPRVSGIFGTTWHANRCSSAHPPPAVTVPGGTTYEAMDYWQGTHAHMPGGGELLAANGGTSQPANGQNYRWLTPAFTYFSCLPSIRNGGGEGFLAITADGTRYWFDWMAQHYETPLSSPATAVPNPHVMNRRRHVLYATRVEDRFGNWVTYSFSNAATVPVRLVAIDASDGRRISLAYNTQGQVASATASGRTWSYGYAYPSSFKPTLTTVTLPDVSRWLIDFASLSDGEIQYAVDPPRACGATRNVLDGGGIGVVTHPSGARGEFEVRPRRHGRSNVPKHCINWEFTPLNDPTNDVAYFVRDYWTLSLVRKSIFGPALNKLEWNYSLGSLGTFAAGTGPICNTPNCADPVCLSDTCAGRVTTTVTGPGGKWLRYRFGNSYRYDEGKLLSVEIGTGPGSILQTETTVYELGQSGQPFPTPIGSSLRARGDGFSAEHLRPRKRHTIHRDGTNFLWEATAFDQFARPTHVTRSSSLGYSRSEQTGYHDHLGAWVLGQVAWVYHPNSNSYPEQTVYDPSTALPTHRYSFGRLTERIVYHDSGAQSGLPWQIYDGSNVKRTTLGNYHRGIPRSIVYHDGSSESATVNDHGEITGITSPVGFTTGYEYDLLGRIRRIIHPAGDDVAWSDTFHDFEQVTVPEYGIDTGHWRHTVRTGNARTVTYLDGLWRPVLTRTFDAGNESATRRMVVRRFDHANREIFASYPRRTIDAINARVPGNATEYDALGRPTRVRADSELGVLSTDYAYLPGFQTRTTDPRGHQVTTAYQAYDQPATDWPVALSLPEGQHTSVSRDPWGKPTAITRSGWYSGQFQSLTRRFVYDPQQRLCKNFDPESGWKVIDYDASGNVAWTASGQSLGSLSDCQRGSVAASERSTRSYDSRNRLTFVDHPAGTDDVGFSYYPDGALHTTTTPTSTWTYTYNRRRMLRTETLGADGHSLTVVRTYDANGHPSSLGYPDGSVVASAPNALGEPGQAGSYAVSTSYHPSGVIAGFVYGNSVVHSTSLNLRLLPESIRDTRFNWSQPKLDYRHVYDANANLIGRLDGSDGPDETRSMQYDGLNRLAATDAPGLLGTAGYSYDVLDNLRSVNYGGFLRAPELHTYGYDSLNRLNQIHMTNGSASVVLPYGYDGRGNVTSRSILSEGSAQPHTHTFDRANRMLASVVAGQSENYAYDGHGRRTIVQRTGGKSIQFYGRDGRFLYERRADGVGVKHIYLGGRLVASVTGGVPQYTHTDALGSVVRRTDAGGVEVHRSIVESYGSLSGGTSYLQGQPGFTGHVADTMTHLTYMQQRYYDPVAMRFLSVDPVHVSLATGDNFNRYWYANNNPYKFVDPKGETPAHAAAAVAGGVVGGVLSGALAIFRGASWKEVAAATIGGAVSGAITGGTLGAGSGLGVSLVVAGGAGATGEFASQTTINVVDHGISVGNYDYDPTSIAIGAASNLVNGGGSVVGNLAKEAGASQIEKAVLSEIIGLPFRAVADTELLPQAKEELEPPLR